MNVIVDYGCGNPRSISNMLKKLGFASIISRRPEDIRSATKLIFPGVGSFDFGAHSIRELDIVDALEARVLGDRVPILGICLGLQLFCRSSEEGKLPGLGWINADCVRFDDARLGAADKVPHMGWADIAPKHDGGLFQGLPENPRFYFVHSYHLCCDAEDVVAATAFHGYEFTAAIVAGNIAGVQFHPEKSHKFGMKFLDNFLRGFPR